MTEKQKSSYYVYDCVYVYAYVNHHISIEKNTDYILVH